MESMKRPRNFKSKKASGVPEKSLHHTADEILQSGVELEEAGEKWRAGDVDKSLRFFRKAIDCYGCGLSEHPQSFDLAYNKARLLLDLTQQERFTRTLRTVLHSLLQDAIDAHHVALELRPDDPDALFNLGQALVSLAETKLDNIDAVKTDHETIFCSLREALAALKRCRHVQEQLFTRQQDQAIVAAPIDNMDDAAQSQSSNREQETVWASVYTPITAEDIEETRIAEINALVTFCQAERACRLDKLNEVASIYTALIGDREVAAPHDPKGSHCQGMIIAKASFVYADASARYTLGVYDEQQYHDQFNTALTQVQPLLKSADETSAAAICFQADAHAEVYTTIQTALGQSLSARKEQLQICAFHIKAAIELYHTATTIPSIPRPARGHISAGDCGLILHHLTSRAQSAARKDYQTLDPAVLSTAAHDYQSALLRLQKQLFLSLDEKDELLEASVKLALLEIQVTGNASAMMQIMQTDTDDAKKALLRDVRDQDLFTENVWQALAHI